MKKYFLFTILIVFGITVSLFIFYLMEKIKGYNNSPTIFNYITGKIDKIEDDVLIVSGKWDKIQQNI